MTSLYVDSGNFRAFKILIAAEYNGMQIAVPEYKAGDNKSPAFLAKSPLGRVPVLDTPQGAIFESNAIARYVAGSSRTSGLMGATYFDSAKVDSWVDFCTHEMELPASVWFYPAFGFMDANAGAIAKAKVDLAKSLAVLDAHLADKTYLVGEGVTLADIAIVSALVYPFKFVADAAYRKPFANVMRWFDTCVHQPQFQAVVGDVVLAKSEMTSGAAPTATTGNKKGKGDKKDKAPKEKKEKAPKEEKPKKEKAPKEEKPPKEEEEEPKPVVKVEHPFKIMDKEKPSPFSMDTWKKEYSNCNGNYANAMAYLWENLDTDGWSLFRGDYMYDSENTVLFMTSNLIGGFIQRTEEIRKWLFGTMTIRGDESKKQFKITCYYLIRGQSIEPLITANDDAAYYNWKKVDMPASDADKAMIMEYWCSEGPLEGEENLDSRVYK
jgi:elongation factor 1-gamma